MGSSPDRRPLAAPRRESHHDDDAAGLGTLRDYQQQIDRGLRALLGKDAEWSFPGRPCLQRRDGFRMVIEGDEAAGILGGIASLILETGDRLRACDDPACGAPFVATRRQRYCRTSHSQRVRNQARMEKLKAAMRNEGRTGGSR